jgi:hypothetical protein
MKEIGYKHGGKDDSPRSSSTARCSIPRAPDAFAAAHDINNLKADPP